MKTTLFTVMLLCALGTSTVKATTNETNYTIQQVQDKNTFVGKWMTVVPETPIGDVKSVIEIVKDKKGNITAKSNAEYTVQKTKVTDDTLTIIADSEGHYCEIILKIVDENTLKGTAMEQYQMTATRIVE